MNFFIDEKDINTPDSIVGKSSKRVDEYVAFASDLGFPPGRFPVLIDTNLGNKQKFVLDGNSGTEEAVIYKQEFGCITLRVFND